MVYIDNMNASYGRMKMCHMIADSSGELLSMAKAIGVHRRHLQEQGTHREHFDICLSSKSKAIKLGAIEVSRRNIGLILRKKKDCKLCITKSIKGVVNAVKAT